MEKVVTMLPVQMNVVLFLCRSSKIEDPPSIWLNTRIGSPGTTHRTGAGQRPCHSGHETSQGGCLCQDSQLTPHLTQQSCHSGRKGKGGCLQARRPKLSRMFGIRPASSPRPTSFQPGTKQPRPPSKPKGHACIRTRVALNKVGAESGPSARRKIFVKCVHEASDGPSTLTQ